MIGIPIALFVHNASEWYLHKRYLHQEGRDKSSPWSFHWHEHHRNARQNAMRDETYERFPFGKHAQGKELMALIAMGLMVLPLAPVAPFYTGTTLFCIAEYYVKHKKSHEDPEWARRHLPWHYDHHMGPNQNANWCVTRPWFDLIMGTREPYVGTERERLDREKRSKRAVAGTPAFSAS